jgi:hypothetical protein
VRHDLPMEPRGFDRLCGGEWLRILDGPLSGLCGSLVRVRGEQRLLISIELLHRQVLVELPTAYVELAQERMLHIS